MLRKLRSWSALWGVPELADSVEITFSDRLRASLGRCQPARGRVRLSSRLRHEARSRLYEALCHELAHIAVYRLHGPGALPHGVEWKALVRAAGFEPAVCACVVETSRGVSGRQAASTDHGNGDGDVGRRGVVASSGVSASSGIRVASSGVRFAHRCPVCQTVRYARAPVHRWRCAACLEAGLEGVLEITSEPAAAS